MSESAPTDLGSEYIDPQTGISGIAVASTRYQHGCERITLEWVVGGEIKTETFDAPRLLRTSDQTPIDYLHRPGGNKSPAPRAAAPGRH